jgi:rod shape-determining protein MreD
MYWRQSLVVASAIFFALILQLSVLSRLGLPGATPDLLVVTVVALALAMGPTQGAVAGFAAGALLDIAPPSDTVIGINSIVYLVIGYLAGLAIDPRDRTVPITIGIVGLSTAGATLATTALSGLLGNPRVLWDQLPSLTLSSALYGVLLAPLMVPTIAWIVRRVTPEVVLDRVGTPGLG